MNNENLYCTIIAFAGASILGVRVVRCCILGVRAVMGGVLGAESVIGDIHMYQASGK